MAKRKKTSLGNLDAVLGGQPQDEKVSYESQLEHNRPDDKKSISYRLGTYTRERVNEVAEKHNVQKSDLVYYLLHLGIDRLEAGEITLPTIENDQPRKIGVL